MSTVSLLADALKLTGDAREQFKVAARAAAETAAGEWIDPAGLSHDAGPHAWLAYIVATLDERGVADARLALAQWQERTQADPAWLDWAGQLIALTADGRLRTAAVRPLPAGDRGSAGGQRALLGRQHEVSELGSFLNRVQHGRGGLALVLGPSGIGKSLLITRVLTDRLGDSQAEWITFDRGEAGYLGWRRLLEPLWATVRRTELAPASLLKYAPILDDILLADPLLAGGESEPSSTHLPGDAAAAVAALLAHEARRKPLILVIDDAHRGGLTSDQLLLGVASRINACRAGLIAALRPDEMDGHSPLGGYSEQAGGRAAADVVTPIRLAPLSLSDTAELLSSRIHVTPPPEIVEQVARQTGGRPQLIDHIQLEAPADGTNGSWVIRLGAEGLRVLLDTINSRPEPVRDVLRAAAVCAEGGRADPDLVARVTGQAEQVVEQILDDERRRGSILAPLGSGYRFQHDSWIEELINSCPRAMFHALHARRLALLRADPAADPRQVIRYATHAGAAAGMSDEELTAVATQAADQDIASYAFSAAAERYGVAASHATGAQQVDLMIRQSDALRFCGRWREARDVLQQAARAARQLAMPQREAVALVHFERLTWSYGLDEQELTQQFRDVMKRLPADETVLLAQVKAGLARRLTIVPRLYENEQADLGRAALAVLPSVTDPLAAAEILSGSRCALQDIASPEELLGYDSRVLELGLGLQIHDPFHIGEALSARVVDLLRAGRLGELPSALRDHRSFAERSATPTVLYTQALLDAMLALAQGEFSVADRKTAEAVAHSKDWGGSMANEALTAQVGWLLYEKGEVEGLAGLVAELQSEAVSSQTGEVWRLGTALIYAENGETESARGLLGEVCRGTDDLRRLLRGPARIGILATAAMVLGHPAVCDAVPADEARRLGTSIARLLADHPDTLVIAGWPAVLLGSKRRYIGLAYLAAGQAGTAAEYLTRAAAENSDFSVLHARTRFDLARALIRQPGRYREGLAEMRHVHRKAEELQLAGLAKQAAAQLPPP